MAVSPAPETILGVAALTRRIKETLTESFPAVWVKGELSSFVKAESGHLYFSLKEGNEAILECVMWRTDALRLGFAPRNGLEVEAFGGISVYEPRGRYRLFVQTMRPGGLGALLLALEELKRRLAAEGLFDAARKRKLPRYPKRIGLVTSPIGAAVRDLVKVLRARWPSIEIVLAPVRVQGLGAALEIAAAIERFNRYGKVDLLVVGRGGGSLEDLWAFNEEPVVRAIAGSRLPVISAVGHEVDTTRADLAADVRAATPSNAGEIAVRSRVEVARHVAQLRARLDRGARHVVEARRQRLIAVTTKYHFRKQKDLLAVWKQRIDDLAGRLNDAARFEIASARRRIAAALESYAFRNRHLVVERRRELFEHASRGLTDAIVATLLRENQRLLSCGARLRALSPRSVMDRGYCLVRAADGRLLRSVEGLDLGDDVSIEFARGEADARVTAVRPGGANDR